jgi:hypothetical protein
MSRNDQQAEIARPEDLTDALRDNPANHVIVIVPTIPPSK